MKTTLPALVALAAIVLSGVVHGMLAGRWKQSNELADAVLRLKDVPIEIGDWTSQDSTIPDRHLKIGGIEGYLSRRYSNGITGSAVNVLIVCGRPGPISVHTPDACFQGAGFSLAAPIVRHEIADDGATHFGTVCFGDFHKQSGAFSESVRVFWTWGSDKSLSAPENPRLSFAGKAYLYKIYVTRTGGRTDEPPEGDICEDFLRLLHPQLQATIFCRQ